MSALEVGQVVAHKSYPLTRDSLVRYAGASGDFNPIHWSDRVAGSVGLPGVIAHGMLTMALAGRLVTQWAGDPALVRSFGVRFTRPVVVPDDDEGAVDDGDDPRHGLGRVAEGERGEEEPHGEQDDREDDVDRAGGQPGGHARGGDLDGDALPGDEVVAGVAAVAAGVAHVAMLTRSG